MIVEFHDFDGMDPPGATAPLRVALLHPLSSGDGAEYWLARPERPIRHHRRDGSVIDVDHVIVAPGWVGASFHTGVRNSRVNLAYVIDPRQVTEQKIDFSKADYVACGLASLLPGDGLGERS